MSWNSQKREELISALNEAYARDTFDRLLRLRLNTSVDDLVGNKGFEIQLQEIVTILERRRMLTRLAKAAAKDISGDPVLRRLLEYAEQLERLDTAEELNLWVEGGPWLNRDSLVQVLISLASPGFNNARVIVVKGTPRTGRTYTIGLLRHLERTSPVSTRFIPVDLETVADDENLVEIQAFHLAWAIAAQMHPDLRDYVRETTPDEFKLSGFANEFHRIVQESRQRVIIVIDSFNRVSVAGSTPKLLARLTEKLRFQHGECHLVLLGYEEEITGDNTVYVEKSLPNFTEDDLLDYFTRFYEQYLPTVSANFTPGNDQVAVSVDNVCHAGDLAARPNVEIIGKAVLAECQRVIASAGGA